MSVVSEREHIKWEIAQRRKHAAADRRRAGLKRDRGHIKAPTGGNERVWLLGEADRQDRIADELERRLGVPETRELF